MTIEWLFGDAARGASAPLAAAGLATAAERHHALLPVLIRILRLLLKLSAAALGKVAVVKRTVAIAPPSSPSAVVPAAAPAAAPPRLFCRRRRRRQAPAALRFVRQRDPRGFILKVKSERRRAHVKLQRALVGVQSTAFSAKVIARDCSRLGSTWDMTTVLVAAAHALELLDMIMQTPAKTALKSSSNISARCRGRRTRTEPRTGRDTFASPPP